MLFHGEVGRCCEIDIIDHDGDGGVFHVDHCEVDEGIIVFRVSGDVITHIDRCMHDDERTLICIQIVRDKGQMVVEIGIDAELTSSLEIKLLRLDGVVSTRLGEKTIANIQSFLLTRSACVRRGSTEDDIAG